MRPFTEIQLDREMIRKCEDTGELLYCILHKNYSCLYQWLEKHHLDKGYELTQDQWEMFVETTRDRFAEKASEIAVEYFENFKTRIGIKVTEEDFDDV